jgi:hypothetical protein
MFAPVDIYTVTGRNNPGLITVNVNQHPAVEITARVLITAIAGYHLK